MVAPLSQLPLKWQLAGRRLTVSPDLREALGTFQMESRRGADHKMELPKQAMVDKNRHVFFFLITTWFQMSLRFEMVSCMFPFNSASVCSRLLGEKPIQDH